MSLYFAAKKQNASNVDNPSKAHNPSCFISIPFQTTPVSLSHVKMAAYVQSLELGFYAHVQMDTLVTNAKQVLVLAY